MTWIECTKMLCKTVGIEELSLMEIVVTVMIIVALVSAWLHVPICQFKRRKGWGDFIKNFLFGGLAWGLSFWLFYLEFADLRGVAMSPLSNELIKNNLCEIFVMIVAVMLPLDIVIHAKPKKWSVLDWCILLYLIIFI